MESRPSNSMNTSASENASLTSLVGRRAKRPPKWVRLALNRLPQARMSDMVVVQSSQNEAPQHSSWQSEQIAVPQSEHFATAGLPQSIPTLLALETDSV
jgi:hypothetical protein